MGVCTTLVVGTVVLDQKSNSSLPKLGFAFAKDYLVSSATTLFISLKLLKRKEQVTGSIFNIYASDRSALLLTRFTY